MGVLRKSELLELLEVGQPGPCVSLFMPAHEVGPERMQDRIRLKNLTVQAEEKLAACGTRLSSAKELLAPAHALVDDPSFWRKQSKGLAVFARPGFFRSYRVPLELSELVVTTHRFHLKPLLPLLMNDGRFYLLTLSLAQARLYQGARHYLTELDPQRLPQGLKESLERVALQEAGVRFHQTGPAPTVTGTPTPKYHAQGESVEQFKERRVDDYLTSLANAVKDYLADEQSPLVLAALDVHQGNFRRLNTYPFLVEQGLSTNPDALSEAELHKLAYEKVLPLFEKEKNNALEQYRMYVGNKDTRAAWQMQKILPAAVGGRIDTLVLHDSESRWGRFDPTTQKVMVHPEPLPDDEDLTDLAAVQTLLNRGKLFILPAQEAPGVPPIAAVFRY